VTAPAPRRSLLARLLQDAVRAEDYLVPAALRPQNPENRIPVALAIVGAVAMQYAIPDKYGLHPRWLIPSLELLLLAILVALNPVRFTRATPLGKYLSFLLVIGITVDNAVSAGILDYDILTAKASGDATGLLGSGAAIYLTNVIAFAIWYWELDRGGPFSRLTGRTRYPDFLFPQMTNPEIAPAGWAPQFIDYLYVSFTNVVAFSPTDTMPLSRWAKALMTVQSVIALSTTALVIARAVNVLK
jgi:hypothetical protein